MFDTAGNVSTFLVRSAVWAVILAFPPLVQADSTREIMASRYMKTQFCIERAVGQRWHEKYQIPLVMNRWGTSEPTIEGLAAAPESVRNADARCRRENGIEDEARPSRE